MKNCKICNKNPANKKGSHIVPHFLLKRIINVKGQKGRDKELSFTFDNFESTSYFGRGILPEKLKSVYGDVNEDLIQNNKSNDIVDNYFCTECETKLGQIENEYSKSLSVKSDSKPNQKFCTNSETIFLFWITILWRLSIQKDSGFKLKPKDERKLGRIIHKYFRNDISKIKFELDDSDLMNIGYKILRAPNYSLKESTIMYWQANYERPYSLIIDEFILFFYFKKNYLKGMELNFFGTEFQKNSLRLSLHLIKRTY